MEEITVNKQAPTESDIRDAVASGMRRWTLGMLTWGMILTQCIVIVVDWVYPALIPDKYLYLPLVVSIFPFILGVLNIILGLTVIAVGKALKSDK